MSDPSRRRFLQGAGIAATGGLLPASIARALAIPANRRTGTIQDVQHVVILMQENRSFDHYYGSLRGVQGFADPHPVPLPGGRPVCEQRDKHGRTIAPFHLDTQTTAALKVADLPHSWKDATGAAHGGRWDDWIAWKTPLTMGHYRRVPIRAGRSVHDLRRLSLLGPWPDQSEPPVHLGRRQRSKAPISPRACSTH